MFTTYNKQDVLIPEQVHFAHKTMTFYADSLSTKYFDNTVNSADDHCMMIHIKYQTLRTVSSDEIIF